MKDVSFWLFRSSRIFSQGCTSSLRFICSAVLMYCLFKSGKMFFTAWKLAQAGRLLVAVIVGQQMIERFSDHECLLVVLQLLILRKQAFLRKSEGLVLLPCPNRVGVQGVRILFNNWIERRLSGVRLPLELVFPLQEDLVVLRVPESHHSPCTFLAEVTCLGLEGLPRHPLGPLRGLPVGPVDHARIFGAVVQGRGSFHKELLQTLVFCAQAVAHWMLLLRQILSALLDIEFVIGPWGQVAVEKVLLRVRRSLACWFVVLNVDGLLVRAINELVQVRVKERNAAIINAVNIAGVVYGGNELLDPLAALGDHLLGGL